MESMASLLRFSFTPIDWINTCITEDDPIHQSLSILSRNKTDQIFELLRLRPHYVPNQKGTFVLVVV